MILWQGRSGRLHKVRACSGGSRASMKRVTRTPEELKAIWDTAVAENSDPSFKICKCAWQGKV